MSKPPRIALIHIGKTGGMSLRFALQKFFDDDEFCPLHHEAQFPADMSALARFNLFDAHIGYEVASRLDAKLITVLRNPYDRVVSLYHYWRESSNDGPLQRHAKSLSFERFLSSADHPVLQTGVINTQTWQLAFSHYPGARERHRGIRPDDLLDRAKQNLRHLAVVGVQEDMPTLAAEIATKLGLPVDLSRRRANTTKSRPLLSQIGLDIREKIHPLVSIDLALYEHVLSEYVFSARPGSVASAQVPHPRAENADKAPRAPRKLVPSGLRKAISINGIRKLVRV